MPFLPDLHIALRSLLRSPSRLLVPAVVLGLALGSVVVMWATLRYAVLENPPLERADRLYTIALGAGDEADDLSMALPDLQIWWMAQTSFEGLAGFRARAAVVADAGQAGRRTAGLVTGPFFQLLRQRPLLGRVLGADDTRSDAPPVVVLSERLWSERLGARADAIGRTIRVDGVPMAVVGVVPAGFDLPVGADLWLAYRTAELGAPERWEWFTPVGRLRDGVSPADAQSELAALSGPRRSWNGLDQLARPGSRAPELRPLSLVWLGPRYVRILRALFLSVTLVLALAAANVAGLLLIRAAGRAHEAAIRRALGASRARLTLELLAEPAVIGAAAALLGLTLAAASLEALERALPHAIHGPAWLRLRLDGQLLLVLGGAALAATLAAGIYPAVAAAGGALDPLLREGTRRTGLRASGLVRGLVVIEIALSAVVLTSAAVVVRAANRLGHGDVGVPTAGLLIGRLALPTGRYDWGAACAFFASLDRRLQALPGAEGAALTHSAPGLWGSWRDAYHADTGAAGPANVVPVGPRLFETLGIPIVAGRPIAPADLWGAPEVAVVSQALAGAAFPGQSPLGRRLRVGPEPHARTFTVVGVAGNVRHDERVQSVDVAFPTVYLALQQAHRFTAQVVVRARPGVDPHALAPWLRRAVEDLDPDVALDEVGTLDEERQARAAGFGLIGWMFTAFGAVAVVLAAAGVYGVLAGAVAQGARELALRRALGAPDRAIVLLIVRRSGGQLATGLGLGAAAAPFAARALGATLETQQHVAGLYVGVALLLVAVVVAAVAVPVRRALRLDPGPELRRGS